MALIRSICQTERHWPYISKALVNYFSTKTKEVTSNLESQSVEKVSKEIIGTCNNLARENSSRCFAIVHLLGKQWRVTDGDLIAVEGFWPPNIGDKLRLDKVLVAGTKDFSLIGRPLVQQGLVNITATVISKGLSHTKTHFKMKPHKQFMRTNFHRNEQTVLRINSVEIKPKINAPDNVL